MKLKKGELTVERLFEINMEDRDTKGNMYEYLLSKIAIAGKNGQFRTPRHFIMMMVEMVRPTPEDIVCDPSAGSCGFLVYAVSPGVVNDEVAFIFFQELLESVR
jgi:type I restriction enzyme M protein